MNAEKELPTKPKRNKYQKGAKQVLSYNFVQYYINVHISRPKLLEVHFSYIKRYREEITLHWFYELFFKFYNHFFFISYYHCRNMFYVDNVSIVNFKSKLSVRESLAIILIRS